MSSNQPPFEEIGKYRIESVIGQGAMGVVYKGFDPDIERSVAVKMLHAHLMMDQGDNGQSLIARFRQEAQAAARCLHSNIVTVFDFGVIKHSPFMVMEYVDGIDLRSFLRGGADLTIKQAGDLIIQVLDALDYAHARGVVHRDIKPANVLLLESGQVKVTDFGVAKLDTSELTNVGDVIGTPSYMSPEALRGDVVDGRSDLYSTAVLLLELIVGSRPQKSSTAWTQKEVCDLLAASAMLPPQLDKDFQALLMQGLALNPNERFRSGQDFALQLKALISPNQIYVPELDDLAATVVQSKVTKGQAPSRSQTINSQLSSSQIALAPDVSLILSQTLAPYLGPMASRIIKSAASQSMSLQDMIERLSHHIPTENERKDFLSSLNQTGIRSMPTATSFSGVSRVTTIGSVRVGEKKIQSLHLPNETVKKLVQLLAHHVGPLASRIVKKSLQNSASYEDFFNSLASSIPEEAERTDFKTRARSIL